MYSNSDIMGYVYAILVFLYPDQTWLAGKSHEMEVGRGQLAASSPSKGKLWMRIALNHSLLITRFIYIYIQIVYKEEMFPVFEYRRINIG